MHNAVAREYPLQPGLNDGTARSLHINRVGIDHRAHNDGFLTHCTTQQYNQQTCMMQTTASISQLGTSVGGVAFGMAQTLLATNLLLWGFTWPTFQK